MTAAELKDILAAVCRDCKGRERCVVPDCSGLADAITTAVEDAVVQRVDAAEESGPKLLTMLKQAVERIEMHAKAGDIVARGLADEANAAIAKAEGRE